MERITLDLEARDDGLVNLVCGEDYVGFGAARLF